MATICDQKSTMREQPPLQQSSNHNSSTTTMAPCNEPDHLEAGRVSFTNEYVEMDENKLIRDEKPPFCMKLKFNNIKFNVTIEKGSRWRGKATTTKEILHGITGHVVLGEMLAVMGPSGSGKTTLLNILGGRSSNPQNLEGSILYNGQPFSKHIKKRMGFVTQDDILFPHLTVKETLTFSALLKLPRGLTRDQKIQRAKDVIKELDLQKCSETMIGNQFFRGVSGGEKKRVCIGQEILTDPSLLFLDEPTSGLDSTTALRLIKFLNKFAHGRIVVTTIHQPSSRAFEVFHKLLLLSDGHGVYFGKASNAVAYFESIGFVAPSAINPADLLLDLCSGSTADLACSIADTYTTSDALKQYVAESWTRTEKDSGSEEEEKEGGAMWWRRRAAWGSTWTEQVAVLAARGLKERRYSYWSKLKIAQVVVVAILAGSLWLRSSHGEGQVGLIFFIGVFWTYLPLFAAIFTFPLERAMLTKECASDMYRMSAYFMARTLGDLPLDMSLPFVFMTIVYFMGNLQPTITAFILSMMTIFLTVIASKGFGLFIGAIMMDVQKASTFASVVVVAFMLVGGFFIQDIPFFIDWIRYFSFQGHTYNILIQIQYSNDKAYTTTSDSEMASFLMLHNPSNAMKSTVSLLAMVFGYHILAYISLRRMINTK